MRSLRFPEKKSWWGPRCTGTTGLCPTERGVLPQTVAPQAAAELARKTGARIRYNNRDQAPYFYYRDKQGKKHVVWFENGQSAQARFDLIKEYRVRGVGYWVLGGTIP